MKFKPTLLALLFGATAVLPVHAQEYEDVHACDEYAAHPNDPNRWAKGVADDEIIPGPAVKFCRDAVEQYEATPRFKFQLGRALWAAQRLEDGLEVFLALEEASEYGPVYAYLGDAYMYGIGGIDADQELAVSLYQIASEEGFAPADEIIAALSGEDAVQPQEQTSSVVVAAAPKPALQPAPVQKVVETPQPTSQERPFNRNTYLQKGIMSGLYNGNLDQVRQGNPAYIDVDKAYFYLGGFLKPFQENYNFRDGSCVYLSNPTLVRIVNTKVLKGTPGMGGMLVGNGRSLEQNLDAGAEMGFKMLGDIFQGLNSGRGIMGTDYGQTAIATNLLAENGEKDATRLIGQHGCQSETVQRIFANIGVFVTGRGSPIVSPEERVRLAKLEEEKALQKEKARQNKLRSAANSSCVGQFKKRPYCDCLVKGLDQQNINEEEWKALGKSFREVVAIGKKYPNFASQIKSCRTQGG